MDCQEKGKFRLCQADTLISLMSACVFPTSGVSKADSFNASFLATQSTILAYGAQSQFLRVPDENRHILERDLSPFVPITACLAHGRS
jgi:hypothetical protein